MPTTLSDVAQRAGVSLATASRVLSRSSYGVKAELRERVLAAAEHLRYVPNAHAQALVRASNSTVGVLVHDVSDPYFSEITRGIQKVASDAGRLVMVCNSYRDPVRELEYVALLRAQRVQAIVLAGSGLDDRQYSQQLATQIQEFVDAGGHAVFIGRHHVIGDAVMPDNVGGARLLGRALIARAHRRIGVISGPALLTTTRDRFDGFQSALHEAGLELPPQHVADADFSRDSGFHATMQLLECAPDITAIFALNDLMAVGALAALRERGIAVPDDLSVVGFDDIPIARDVTPALTTVRVPMTEMGARAMTMALDGAGSSLRVEHLPSELIWRASAGPART